MLCYSVILPEGNTNILRVGDKVYETLLEYKYPRCGE